MDTPHTDRVFAGAIPELYERYLVPLIFQPYAVDLARRAAALQPATVLEVAAGTGVVTRQLCDRLPSAAITATDLNPAMLAQAQAVGTSRPVNWQPADAMALPLPDASVDLVVCQFGAMFFPDRPHAYAEMRRVLRPGGRLLFNIWDRIEDNEFADVTQRTLATLYPADPPRFMARVPHGYHDPAAVLADLQAAGFARQQATLETVTHRSEAASPRIPAVAYCQGTPWRSEIEARGTPGLAEATEATEREIARCFGSGPVSGRIQAHVVCAAAPG